MPAQRPSAWINLQDYAKINEGAGEQMGAKVAGDVGGAAGAAQKQLSGAQDKFATQRAAGSNEFNPYDAQWSSSADAKAKAGNDQYSGPQDLNQSDPTLAGNVADAVQRVGQAKTSAGQQTLLQSSYGPGGSASGAGGGALDSFLLSTGGASAMQGLQDKYGKLGDQYQQAEGASVDSAQQAQTDTAANAAKWGQVATQKKGAEDAAAASKQAQADAADKKAPPLAYESTFPQDTPQNRQDYMMTGVDKADPKAVAKRQAEIADYQKAMHLTDQNQADRTFEDINQYMSPLSWITNAAGVRDPIHDAGVKMYGSTQQAGQSGSTTGTPISWDRSGVNGFFVYRQMTPDQWEVLNKKPPDGPNGQLAWITARAAELRAKTGEQNGGAGRNRQHVLSTEGN